MRNETPIEKALRHLKISIEEFAEKAQKAKSSSEYSAYKHGQHCLEAILEDLKNIEKK